MKNTNKIEIALLVFLAALLIAEVIIMVEYTHNSLSTSTYWISSGMISLGILAFALAFDRVENKTSN